MNMPKTYANNKKKVQKLIDWNVDAIRTYLEKIEILNSSIKTL